MPNEIVTTWSPSGNEVRTAPNVGESMGEWLNRHLDAVDVAPGQSSETSIVTEWPAAGMQTVTVQTDRATGSGDPPEVEIGPTWRGRHYRAVAGAAADTPQIRGGS